MILARLVISLNVVILLAISAPRARAEQPSTVFVLDTSDSDSPPQLGSNSDSVDTNTKIISDETSPSGSGQTANLLRQNNQTNNNNNNNNNNQRHTTSSSPSNEHTHGQNVSSRRLEEVAHVAPPAHKVTNQHQHQPQHHNNGQASHQHQQQNQHKPTSTTPQSPNYNEQNSGGSGVPKTEERLLISISSEDPDEQPYKKVSSGGGVSSSGYDPEPGMLGVPGGSPQQAVHHHQKRKPSITISIQDANINKQNGGSGGTQAVIVRPGDDGQSIVIATVGSANSSNGGGGINQNNKYRPPQPAPNDSINIPVTHQQQQRPYNEPINNPIQSIVAQHQITSTTRRPPPAAAALGNDYNNPSPTAINQSNRPISSTLVDQQRPPVHVTDERPHRPTQPSLEDNSRPSSHYETPRPTNQQLRPTQEPYSGNSGGAGNYQDPNSEQTSSSSNNDNQYQGDDGQSARKYPLNEKNCGIMHETRIVGGDAADPDDFMWMAAIIKSKPSGTNSDPRPFCGGSLITRRHILTAAHCLEGLAPRDVLVRLGSYDFDDSASSTSADYAIDQFRVPAQYSRKTHVADLAIMRLKTPLSPSDQYKTVCMPQPRRSYVGANGLVTGYGSQSQTFRKAAPKLRQVTVPIWENRKCSKVYNKTMGDSFLCAGYEEGGKDACQGDSGGPIMTEGPEQRMMIVGVVSHGIGCGAPGYPGVYTRTTTFADWIEKNTKE